MSAALPRLFAALVLVLTALPATPAVAGCGCAKPPPAPAPVRPSVAYPGLPVTIFGGFVQADAIYDVVFTSGTSGESVTVPGIATLRRDMGDGMTKPTITTVLPSLPLGPAAIQVRAQGSSTPLLTLPDSAFTVAPLPMAVPSAYGTNQWPGQQLAVGRDGTVYMSLDVIQVRDPMVLDATMQGFPLRFTADQVTFYNAQGILMQRLVTGDVQPIPGMNVVPAAADSADSDMLHYSRHEFVTYFLQHQERQPHAVDLLDPNWHYDGTRHIDHDHLIVAIRGATLGGAAPVPGASAPFTFRAVGRSLFSDGIVGRDGMTTGRDAVVDSFSVSSGTTGSSMELMTESFFAGTTATTDENLSSLAASDGSTASTWDNYSATTSASTYDGGSITYGSQGSVFTNATLSLGTRSKVLGDAKAKTFKLSSGAGITGTRTTVSTPQEFMTVDLPAGLPSLGAVSVTSGRSQTIYGPGSFQLSSLSVGKDAVLHIDNTNGPVTLYVAGQVVMSLGGSITTADHNPEKFAIYVTASNTVSLGANSSFYGVLYAPTSTVNLSGSGEFFGAVLGQNLSLSNGTKVHFDERLR